MTESVTSRLTEQRDHWQGLRLFNIFRAIVAGLFLVLYINDTLPPGLGAQLPGLFGATALAYASATIVFSFLLHFRAWSFSRQVQAQTLTDIGFVSLLSYASGGPDSGLEILLVASIAISSLLQPGRMGFFYAAVASLAMLVQTGYIALSSQVHDFTFTRAGLFGSALFATALLADVLSRRLQVTRELAERRGVDLANLTELNAYVVDRLDEGVLAVDDQDRIHLANRAARQLLELPPDHLPERPDPRLAQALKDWRQNPGRRLAEITRPHGSPLQLRFTPIGTTAADGALVFVEDTARQAERLQDEKLKAMGRLTAGIAHEVRNPIGAISHAAQILREDSDPDDPDRRLMDMILRHVDRIDDLVHSILDLSRQKQPRFRELALAPWLESTRDELAECLQAEPDQLRLCVDDQPTHVTADPTHLRQMLAILCDNGLHHAARETDTPRIEIHSHLVEGTAIPAIDVSDNGPGIAPEVLDKVFEPFYSTHSQNTGLGLFIARELCEANACHIEYVPMPEGGARFRLTFPFDPVPGR